MLIKDRNGMYSKVECHYCHAVRLQDYMHFIDLSGKGTDVRYACDDDCSTQFDRTVATNLDGYITDEQLENVGY